MSTDREALERTARKMVADGKGILAADESNATMSKRLEQVEVEPTEEARRRFRELVFARVPSPEPTDERELEVLSGITS